MGRITDPLTIDEILELEVLLEMELRRIKPNIDIDEKVYQKALDIGMIKGKLMNMKRNIS